MADHKHDPACGCGEEHEDPVFVVTDENGKEMEMVVVCTFETDDRAYAVLLDRNDPDADGVIFRIEEDGEEMNLVGIEDEGEWNRAVQAYERLVEQAE